MCIFILLKLHFVKAPKMELLGGMGRDKKRLSLSDSYGNSGGRVLRYTEVMLSVSLASTRRL